MKDEELKKKEDEYKKKSEEEQKKLEAKQKEMDELLKKRLESDVEMKKLEDARSGLIHNTRNMMNKVNSNEHVLPGFHKDRVEIRDAMKIVKEYENKDVKNDQGDQRVA